MSHSEHLGKAYANIVYAFLTSIDCGNYDESMLRLFQRDSPERSALFEFLMRKRAHGPVNDGVEFLSPGEPSSLWQLERSIATSDLVALLTIVRNLYVADFCQNLDFPSLPSESDDVCDAAALLQISVAPPRGLSDGGVPLIKMVVVSLCECLRQRRHRDGVFSQTHTVQSLPDVTAGDAVRSPREADQRLFCATVEAVWAYSLCAVLAPRDSAFLRSGGLLLRARRSGRPAAPREALPRLSDAPPALFLSCALCERLVAHLRVALLAPPAPGAAAWRQLLLAGACYAHVTAAGGASARAEWRRLVRACAAPDGSEWQQVVADAAERDAAEDLAAAWQRHSAEWSNDAPGALPVVLSKELPALAAVGVDEAVAAVAAAVTGAGRTERSAAADSFGAACRFVRQLCHVYGFCDKPHVKLPKLLELVSRMLVVAKKDKRIRELIAATLAGCTLSEPFEEVTISMKAMQSWVANVLEEIDAWRKLKNAACYSILVAALLHGCLPRAFEHRLIGLFENISSWFCAVDALDQFVILHATIHAVGLLTEAVDRCNNKGEAITPGLASCVERCKQCVDAVLVKGIGRECGRTGAKTVAAFDLLMFVIQHPLFFSIATEDWLPRLMRTKRKSKLTSKVFGSAEALSNGQMIAMWAICALYEMTERKNGNANLGISISEILTAGVPEAESVLSAFSATGSARERLSGVITAHNSRFASVVASVDYLRVVWRSNSHPQAVLLKIRALPGMQQAIDFMREEIFTRIPLCQLKQQQLSSSVRRDADDGSVCLFETTKHLAHAVRAVCFWGPPQVVLDRTLVIPMQLAGPRTLLQDTVTRDILPFFLHHDDDSMMSSALVLHRLAESIVVCLSAGEDERVEPLTAHLMSFLLRTANHWRGVLSDECNTPLDPQRHTPAPSRVSNAMCEAASHPSRARWEWLFSPFNAPSLVGEWRVIGALRGCALIDTLEAVALVLLGHSSCRVRHAALRQLGTLATLARLYRQAEAEAGNTSQLLSAPTQAPPAEGGRKTGFARDRTAQFEAPVVPDQTRVAIADVLGELEDYFSQRYDILRERYFALSRTIGGAAGAKHSNDMTPSKDGSLPNMSLFNEFVFEPCEGPEVARAAISNLENSAFGVLCLADDCSTPNYVFTSALALTLVKYCYRPGSAAVRVACAVAGEIALSGARQHIERSRALSSTWGSCYALYGVLALVDNTSVSPDANRLTNSAERNRPGHQHGGNVTFVGGMGRDSGVSWQIVNRQFEYNRLLMDITLPLFRFEVRPESSVTPFVDEVQYLFAGPIELAPDATLVIFTGILSTGDTIAKELLAALSNSSKSRNNKQLVAYASLSVLFPLLHVFARRFFVSPPIVTGIKESFIAMKRSQMELIIEEVIEAALLGEDTTQDDVLFTNTPVSTYSKPMLVAASAQTVGRILNPGHGVSVRSWLVLPFVPPGLDNGRGLENILSEMTPIIVLRGTFCDLLRLVYTHEAHYFEPHFKSRLLERVFTSLSLQVNWFMWTHQSCICVNPSGVALQSPIRHRMSIYMEKTILALQTVISSVCPPTGGLRIADNANALGSFSRIFFKWLQETLHNYGELGSLAPRVFDLAVTLLVADAPSRALVGVILCKAPLGGPMHSTFFAALAKSVSVLLTSQESQDPLYALGYPGKAEASIKSTRSEGSHDTYATPGHTAIRATFDGSGSTLVFYALAYLYEDAITGPLYDAPTRRRAQDLIELLGGDVLPGTALLEEALCLLRRTNRRHGSAEYTAFLVHSLFRMAANEVLEAGRKTTSPFQLQRIALRLLGLVIESVEATRENLSVILQVTKVCRGNFPDEALAALWGGWVAYEGHERERFISLLVAIPFDLAEKRIITLYIDNYIKNEMSKLEKETRGGLGARSRGVYYNFLFFCLHQIRVLREAVVRTGKAQSCHTSVTRYDQRYSCQPQERRHLSQPLGHTSEGSQVMHSSLSRSPMASYPPQEISSAQRAAPPRGPQWVVQENIWWDTAEAFSETCECLSGQPSPNVSGKGIKSRDGPSALQTHCFEAPATSVLFFATWAMDRLNTGEGYDRLWRTLQRDMLVVAKYFSTTNTLIDLQHSSTHSTTGRGAIENCDGMSFAWSPLGTNTKYYDVEKVVDEDDQEEQEERDDDGDGDAEEEEEEEEDAEKKEVLSQNHCQSSSDTSVSPSGAAAVVIDVMKAKECDAECKQEDSKNKSSGWSISSDETVIVHQNVPVESVTEAMNANLCDATSRAKLSIKPSQANGPTRALQRDCSVMLLHLACALLVHIGRGAQHNPVTLAVVESAFGVVGGQVHNSGEYRVPPAVRRWLQLTGRRVAVRDSAAAMAFGEADLAVEPSLRGGEPQESPRGRQAEEPMCGCPCASVDAALEEFFLGLAGRGRNRRGRSFVVRCLHESSAWASGDCADVRHPRRAVRTYIALLSLKIARSVSSCLAATSGVAIGACVVNEQWIERTPMAVAAEDAFRKLLAALARHVTALCSAKLTSPVVQPTSFLSPLSAPDVQLLLCRSVMTSLGCLLRDILIHESHCTAAMPFGANNSFPTRYIHAFFWCGFALLIAPRLWPSACDLLAVYHRYGCTRLFGKVEVPALAAQHRHALCMDEAPECAAVQLVLLQQGLATHNNNNNNSNNNIGSSKNSNSSPDYSRKRHDDSTKARSSENGGTKSFGGPSVPEQQHMQWCCEQRRSGGSATLAALNYLCAYASAREDCALPLAFAELILLCDWNGLRGEALDRATHSAAAASSFLQCLSLLAGAWRRSRAAHSDAHKGRASTPQSLSTLLSGVLSEFFGMAVRMFGVTSVDVLLRRASAGPLRGADSPNSLSMLRCRSRSTDLCSLSSHDDLMPAPHELSMMSDKSVAAFQSCFESLVMWPLMSLFQSPRTPVVLWCKILAFLAALLRYHALKHGFVTDMLLKFLPDVERGLDLCTVHEACIEDSLLFDRLALPVLADDVAAKVHALKTSQTGPPEVSGYDAQKRPSHIVSIVDNEALMGALMEYLVRDTASFFSHGLPRDASVADMHQEQDPNQFHAMRLHHLREELPKKQSGERCREEVYYRVPSNNIVRRTPRNAFEEDGKDAGAASQRGAPCSSPLTSPVTLHLNGTANGFPTPRRSHRFGEYVYAMHSDVAVQDQMSLEYYSAQCADGIFTDSAKQEEEKDEAEQKSASRSLDSVSKSDAADTTLSPSLSSRGPIPSTSKHFGYGNDKDRSAASSWNSCIQ